MPTFSRSLEQTLHRALALANERHHEYATLEHLLLSLVDDEDAAARDARLQRRSRHAATQPRRLYRRGADQSRHRRRDDAKPTAGFQRVIQRAVIHVQSSGREEVTGANVLVAMFAERESHAAYFLQEQDMTRYDAVNYISHGIAKRPGASESRPGARLRRGARAAAARQRADQGNDDKDKKKKERRSTPIASTSTTRRATATSTR